MKYPRLMHWSEGQFLQPHHFQRMQHSFSVMLNCERSMYLPYPFGIVNLTIDTDALHSNRVVIKTLSAIMPDGCSVSMPGNCEISPLTLDVNSQNLTQNISVYLAVPFYSESKCNLTAGRGSNTGRFELTEEDVYDENSGENEVLVTFRNINARLITDPKKATDCTILPILQLKLVYLDNRASSLIVEPEYTPPLVVIEKNANLFEMVSEFIYELKSRKSKILTDIEVEGFDPKLITGTGVLTLMQLQLINRYINTLSTCLIPEKATPHSIYLILSNMLSELKALYPLSDNAEITPYDHYDLFRIFSAIISEIRTLISSNGKADCIEIEFKFDSSINCMLAPLSDENIIKAKEYYLSLQGPNNWKELISDIEEGDNFRLLDKASHDSRVRGVKLSYVRFPPRYLPMQGSDTVYFKVMRDESPRVWRYIVEDHEIAVDYAQDIFKEFNAKLYLAIVDKE